MASEQKVEKSEQKRERARGQIAAEYFRRNVHFVRCIRNDGDDDDDDVGRTSDANVRHTACSKLPAKKRQSVRGSHPSSYAISLYNIFSVQFLLQIIIILLESLRRIKKTPHTLDQLLARSLASTQWLICVYRKADCIAGMCAKCTRKIWINFKINSTPYSALHSVRLIPSLVACTMDANHAYFFICARCAHFILVAY